MKKIKNTIVMLAVVAMGMQGCSGFLDVDIPDQLVKNEYWKTRDQVKASLTGVYTSIHTNLQLFISWGDLRSDIYMLGAKAEEKERQFVAQDIYTGNGLVDWSATYKGINWANSFLKNAATAVEFDQSLTLEEVESMKSEVYAIRALYYFYLVRAFKEVPYITEPYESDVQEVYYSPLSEVILLDSIESDLKKAMSHAPVSFTNPAEQYGRITRNAVRAIWADVKLWRGDYKGCVTLCEELDAEYKNKMVVPEAWFKMFSEGNSSESIFEYQYVENSMASPLFSLYNGTMNGRYIANVLAYDKNVSTLYPTTSMGEYSDTIRMLGSTLNIGESAVGSGMLNVVFKYQGLVPGLRNSETRSGISQNTVNFIFYRYREILLMKSEALAMLGDYEGATEAVNVIRRATKLAEVTVADLGEGDTFMDNLLRERVAELAYEGKQWFSMVRMARRNQTKELLVERIAQTSGVQLQTMRARLMDPESWFLPYLFAEVENNPLLEQKPYYEGKN